MSGVRGRFFVTPHAVRRYIERCKPWLSYRRALGELISHSESAHYVRQLDSGVQYWRGAAPARLRLFVMSPLDLSNLPSLVSVLPTYDVAKIEAS